MERSGTVRRTFGAVCAAGCAIATARTVSAGVIFCGKEVGTPYNLRGDVRLGLNDYFSKGYRNSSSPFVKGSIKVITFSIRNTMIPIESGFTCYHY